MSIEYATSLNNLAVLYQHIGDYAKALSLYQECVAIDKETLGEGLPAYSISLNHLAKLYYGLKNYEEAWAISKQILNNLTGLDINHALDENWQSQLEQVDYPSHLHINRVLITLELMMGLLEKDSSVESYREKQLHVSALAMFLLAKDRNQLSGEKDQLRMLRKSKYWLDKRLALLDIQKASTQAFELADQNKSVLLLEATQSETAYRLGELPDSLVSRNRNLVKRQGELKAKLVERRSKSEKESLRSELNRVNQDIDEFVKMLREQYPKYHQFKYQQVDAKVQEIQALLDEETALLEYVIADSVVHIFLVDQQNLRWKTVKVNQKDLNRRIAKMHKMLSDYQLVIKEKEQAYQGYTEHAHWFYQQLMAPVLGDKQSIRKLIIIPDGALGHLPFETFLVESAPKERVPYSQLHYLLNDYDLSYNYSARLWKENTTSSKPENNGQIFALAGNYNVNDLTTDRLSSNQRIREQLSPLPAARQEVTGLEELYQGFFAFDGMASEKVLKERAADYAILHFATHGLLNKKHPLLSSLVLTENSDSLNDNFLRAYEISKMGLNANLVTLSACETGYGKFEEGNGIASLARSFMYAGVPSLAVSLWQVNDGSTASIMQNFYRGLASGKAKSVALRQAKLDYLKRVENPVAAHPAFWSPFILIGDESAVEIKKKESSTSLLFGACGGIAAFLCLGIFAVRRKNKTV